MISKTDLARENFPSHLITGHAFDASTFYKESVNTEKGNYATIVCSKLISDLTLKESISLAKILTEELGLFLNLSKNICVIGLGNREMTVDSLGVKTAELISPVKKEGEKLSIIIPGVEASTGFAAFDLISSIFNSRTFEAALAIDSLATRDPSNLGKTIQITDIGITPGSGLGKRDHTLNKDTLGISVISVGIPMVISGSSIMKSEKEVYVALSETDAIINSASRIISTAIENLFL